jgi:hypothetical protein
MDVLVDSTPINFDLHRHHHGHAAHHHPATEMASHEQHSMTGETPMHDMSMPMYFQWSTDVTVLFERTPPPIILYLLI